MTSDYSGGWVGTGVKILKTTNGGESWVRCALPDSISVLPGIHAIDTTHAFAAGISYLGAIILETTDAGSSWTSSLFPKLIGFTDIQFINSFVGYAVGYNLESMTRSEVFKTTNSGIDWFSVTTSPDSVTLMGIRFTPNSSTGIVYGFKITLDTLYHHPFVGRTTDGGTTWNYQELYGLPQWGMLYGGKLLNDSVGYVCGGTWDHRVPIILHTTNGGVTFVSKPDVIAHVYRLYQNYPNPFNPSTSIEYEIPRQVHVTLKIYTVLGQEIATLVEEWQGAGRRMVVWNGLDHNSVPVATGLYIYRLQAGTYFQTRKMIVLR